MTALAAIHPEDFVRGGALLGQVADEVADCIHRARVSAGVRWVGRPNQAYQKRLGSLSVALGRIGAAYERACDALLAYGSALGDVRDLALQATYLSEQAEELARSRQLANWHDATTASAPTPQELDLLQRALRLEFEAIELEEYASRRLARTLYDLAHDAPHVSRWMGVDRAASRFGGGAFEVLQGTAYLAGDLVLALPGMDDPQARQELWDGAKQALQFWKPVTDTIEAFAHGDYAHSSGALAGGLILSRMGGKKFDFFGGHDALPIGVLSSLRGAESFGEATRLDTWVQAHVQAQFLAQVTKAAKGAAPSVGDLLRHGVDLVQQEGLGGHTILKHLGRDVDFLRKRQIWERPDSVERTPISSFLDQTQAEMLIKRVLAIPGNAAQLRTWADRPKGLPITLKGPSGGAGLLVDGSGEVAVTSKVVAQFSKDAKGRVFLNSAYLGDD